MTVTKFTDELNGRAAANDFGRNNVLVSSNHTAKALHPYEKARTQVGAGLVRRYVSQRIDYCQSATSIQLRRASSLSL